MNEHFKTRTFKHQSEADFEIGRRSDEIILEFQLEMLLHYFHEFYLFLLTMSQVGYGDPVSMPANDLQDDRFTWTWFILFG